MVHFSRRRYSARTTRRHTAQGAEGARTGKVADGHTQCARCMLWQGRPHLPPRRAAIHAATTGSPLASHTHDHKQTARQLSAGLATYAPSSPATTRSLPRSPRSTSPSARRQNTPLIRHDASLARALLRRCPLPHIPSMPHTRPHQGIHHGPPRCIEPRGGCRWKPRALQRTGRYSDPSSAMPPAVLTHTPRHRPLAPLLPALAPLAPLARSRAPPSARAQASWCLSRTSKAPMNSL